MLNLRKVEEKDWDIIFTLRNKEEDRHNFYNEDEIDIDTHNKYLEKQKNNPNFYNWLIFDDSNCIGYVRILDNDVSIIIDSKYRTKGYGTKSLELLEIEAKKIGIKKLIGRIKIDNINSKKIFVNNDYKLLMYWYEKNIL